MTTVFLDTETLGVDAGAPIWEFAAIRVNDTGSEVAREHFTIKHDPQRFGVDWLSTLPESFAADYRARYDAGQALLRLDAAVRIAQIVDDGAVIAGSNPAFDMERIGELLTPFGIVPRWQYHPLDVPTLAAGWLAGRGEPIARPWKSNAVSAAAGVNPADYERHTALGDVLWTRDLYEAVAGGVW
ncbi:exonuclease domain-containing protein [Mycolicibacterium goodii]|uniref:exonuclease domain-containing protein n=1 Tax=Mycolicibacterium goodii TaxID=134601 RepID=UPI001BDCD034|nr:exonuclease domain-containing protein [Mycolicibacterium goodii]MBU8832366.1 hypothetical protein [Mycolicibacterium goodii]